MYAMMRPVTRMYCCQELCCICQIVNLIFDNLGNCSVRLSRWLSEGQMWLQQRSRRQTRQAPPDSRSPNSVVSIIRYISVSISIPLLAMYFNSVSIIVLQCISVSISIRQVFQFQFCFTSISVFISVIEFFVFILCGIKKQISKLM